MTFIERSERPLASNGSGADSTTLSSDGQAAMSRGWKAAVAAIAVAMALACGLLLSGCAQQGEGVPGLGEAKLSVPAIGKEGTLRVGVNTANSPMAGNSGDRIIGIDVDIAAALADELGLAVEVVDVGSDGMEALQNDEVDVVLGVESDDFEDGMWLSDEYIETGIVLLEEEGAGLGVPAEGSSPSIAAQVSSKSAWAVTNTFGDESLDATTDLSAAFTSLADGDVQYVASDAIIGLYAANRQGVDVEIVALLESPTGYSAMALESDSELRDAVDDALQTIMQNGTLDVIENKWLGQVIDLFDVTKIETKKDQTTNVEDDGDDAEDDGDDGDDASFDITGITSSSSSSSSSSASTTTG